MRAIYNFCARFKTDDAFVNGATAYFCTADAGRDCKLVHDLITLPRTVARLAQAHYCRVILYYRRGTKASFKLSADWVIFPERECAVSANDASHVVVGANARVDPFNLGISRNLASCSNKETDGLITRLGRVYNERRTKSIPILLV